MRKTLTGVVVSDKMQQTAVIEVARQKIHPILEKRYTRNSRFMAHNPDNTYKTGDTVVIAETRPMSKNKRWEITGKAGNGKGSK
jgi:small subunit ribosomal protein S17